MPMGVLDTLIWTDGGNTNFGGWTKDYFLEYFIPAADGILHSITFNMSDLPEFDGGGMSVWIYNSNYAWPEISTTAIADVCGDAWLGYYEEATKEPFGTNWVNGGINAVTGAIADKKYDPLGAKAWPMIGAGAVSLPPNADDGGFVTYTLLDMGSEYNFTQGDTFLVVIRFNGFPDAGDDDDYRIGFLSAAGEVEPQPAMKFYGVISSPTGRCAGLDDWGWYIRSYLWDWRCNVEYTGDRGPKIADVDFLYTTLSQNARTVTATITDDNPSGGSYGVASANLLYSTDNISFTAVAMTASGDVYSADIPGQAPGTDVWYYLDATDVEGLSSETLPIYYSIFLPTEQTLFIYDTKELGVGTADYYYFAGAWATDAFAHDIWAAAYGSISTELLNNYEKVIHVMGGGPTNQNYSPAAVYKPWLEGATADDPRGLLISGQDYGFISGYYDTTFAAGTFEYDYLGVETLGPQDINYDAGVGAASYQSPYRIDPVDGDALSGNLYAFQGDSVVLFYDPYYEIGANNWIDNLTPVAGAHVPFTDPNNSDAAVAVYNEGTNWKCAFYTFDILSLDFRSPADSASMYHWILNVENALTPIFTWWGEPVLGVEKINTMPKAYALNQNYPNPFNPTTSIAYSIPENAHVKLTIYNMLGQQIRTLVDNRQTAHSYRATWDATDSFGNSVPSGIYFYTIEANNYFATKKMVLLK
ncbi:MAG: T9SS type A sorting domain-containing protein, partial [Candidatus Marinimicrobia bacterium]|nr:T9SS type A sorting domain-containing protein [Candidatus Neomarinimicrobiota bacterium]